MQTQMALSPSGVTDTALEIPQCRVTVGELPPASDLARVWLDLEDRADGSFFTSWTWVGTWLGVLAEFGQLQGMHLVEARRGGTVVGLGILGRLPGPLPRTTWNVLAQTGHADSDSIYVEYNDFLVARDCAEARDALLRACFGISSGDRVRAVAGTPSLMAAVAASGIPHHIWRTENCHLVDLTRIAGARPEDLLAGLTRNSRQQVRRAIRLAKEQGPLEIVRAGGGDADAALADLIGLHRHAWRQRKNMPGAFDNTFFVRFVERLVASGVPSGTVDLLRVVSGAGTVGVLLNFVYRGEIYAYQSGFSYDEDDNRLKPGLVSHVLAAAYYKGRSMCGYHFMAGAARYKVSLSNATEALYWMDIGAGGVIFRAGDIARVLWRKLAGR